MEYFVVLVTSYFRDLVSAPEVRWQARAGAPSLEQEPRLFKPSIQALTSR